MSSKRAAARIQDIDKGNGQYKKSKKENDSEVKEEPFLTDDELVAIASKRRHGGAITGFSIQDYTPYDEAEKDSAAFVHPADWPADGDIDLDKQDLPHDTADTEWWYASCHLEATTGKGKNAETRKFSVFTSFFRIAKEVDEDGKMTHAHAITWAIIDVDNKKYYPDAFIDRSSPDTLEEQLEEGTYELDARMSQAFLEVVREGKIPLPDRLMESDAVVSKKKLDLQYDDHYFRKEKKNYTFHDNNGKSGKEENSMTITLVPKKKPVRQGHNGVVKVGLKTDTMMYYFIPRCEASGEIVVEGKKYKVKGTGWYDHEFGGQIRPHKTVFNKEKADRVAAKAARLEAAKKKEQDEAKAAKKAAAAAKKKSKSKKGSNKGTSDVDESEDGEKKNGKTEATSSTAAAVAVTETKEEKKVAKKPEKKPEEHYAWNWLSCQLDNGTDLSSTCLVQPKTKVLYDNYTVVIDKDGNRTEHADSSLLGVQQWSSCRTSQDYPTLWELEVPSAKIHLQLRAAFPEQELISLIARPGFWEGRLDVRGTINGEAVKGLAFIERQGHQSIDSLDTFFKRINKQVKGEIEHMLPLKPTEEQTLQLATETKYAHFLDGGNRQVFADKVIAPIREVVDRGGKSWRSFAFLLCIDAVGGSSHKFKHWLAMPEIMHVGSLIVDDIQDKSETRRGGPSCHKTYGEAIAINAGTAAYFLAMHMSHIKTKDLPDHIRLRMYDLYMLTLRAGHVGQAFDINGQDYMMDDVVNGTIDGKVLVDRVICTHRLKSAVPAGNLARMGAVVVEVPETQVEALGLYFEAIGVAFQIIDDVLNLRGFEGNGKKRGEDINAGKITFPVALAMQKLEKKEDRSKLWAIVKSKPQDDDVVDEAIALMEKVNAVEGSVTVAKDMVEVAWKALDKEIPHSFYKLMLRAFGLYVLDRHY